MRRERLPLVVGARHVGRAVNVRAGVGESAAVRARIDRALGSASGEVRWAVSESQKDGRSTFLVQITGELHEVSGLVVLLAEVGSRSS